MNQLEKMTQIAQSAWLSSMTAAIAAYFAPMLEIFCVLLIFVTVDLITGLLASRKARIPCNSRRLRKSVWKLVSYILVMVLTYAAERAFDIEWIGSYRFIGGFICLVELISILENLTVLTEKPIFVKIVKLIRGKAQEKHGSMVEDIFNEKNNE